MAEHDLLDLIRLERMERRLQALEDAEAICNLNRATQPCATTTMTRMVSLRSSLRTRPGKAQVSVGSKAATRSAGFLSAAGIFSFAIHYSLNGQIYVDGDTARAQWYLFMPCTVADGNRAMWRASIDHERYRRVDGSWLFSEKRSQPLMNVPFKEGWAQRRF